MRTVVLAVGIAASTTACGGTDPARTADAVTHAVYANDYDGAVSHFDDAIRGSVTRTQLGDLSDRMHALGDYTAIAPRSADPASRKYEYDATFAHGTMLVELRLDADGKVAAYRIAAEPAPSAKAR